MEEPIPEKQSATVEEESLQDSQKSNACEEITKVLVNGFKILEVNKPTEPSDGQSARKNSDTLSIAEDNEKEKQLQYDIQNHQNPLPTDSISPADNNTSELPDYSDEEYMMNDLNDQFNAEEEISNQNEMRDANSACKNYYF